MASGIAATIEEIDKAGNQYVRDANGELRILMGINRAQGVRAGDKGQLTFVSGASYGMWFFEAST